MTLLGRLQRMLVGDWTWTRSAFTDEWLARHDRGLEVRLTEPFGLPADEVERLATVVRDALLDAVEDGVKGKVVVQLRTVMSFEADVVPVARLLDPLSLR